MTATRTPEMIERVAAALWKADERNRHVPWEEWVEYASKHRDFQPMVDTYRAQAKAAIEAMRDPTDGMVQAVLPEAFIGSPEATATTVERWWTGHRTAAIKNWWKYIDAALGVEITR